MGERIRAAASAGAWEAQECLADLLVSLEETELTQRQRQEVAHLAFRAFDGLRERITLSLSVEESLRALGEEHRAS
jgi:hypothetical protein